MTAVFFAGLLAITAGAWLIWPPVGLIVGGVLAVVVALSWARTEGGE